MLGKKFHLDSDTLIITPYSFKKVFLEYKTTCPFYDLKISTLNEVEKGLFGTTNENTLIKCLHQFPYSYEVIEKYLSFISKGINIADGNKTLKEIYDFVTKNNLLFKDDYYLELFKGKSILVVGYDEDNPELVHCLSKIGKTNTNYCNLSDFIDEGNNLSCFKFDSIDEEVHYVLNEICNRLQTDASKKVKIICDPSLYRMYLDIYSDKYKLKLRYDESKSLNDTIVAKELIQHIDEPSLISYLKSRENDFRNQKDHFDDLVNVLSKYEIDKLKKSSSLVKSILSSYKLPKDKYDNEIEVTSQISFDPDSIYYFLNCSDKFAPHVIKNNDIIDDSFKKENGLMPSYMANSEERKLLTEFLKFKNLQLISYHNFDSNGNCFPSALLSELKIISEDNPPKQNFEYSKEVAYVTYSEFNYLNENYKDEREEYYTYKNTLGLINRYDFKYKQIAGFESFKKQFSFTSIDTYYSCPFQFFCKYMLGIYDDDEISSPIKFGNFDHEILTKIYHDDFDFDTVEKEIEDSYELDKEKKFSPKEKLFLIRNNEDLKNVTRIIRERNKQIGTNLTDYGCEKEFTLDLDDGYSLKCKVDNYQIIGGNYLVVYDYKTNNTIVREDYYRFGLGLQLPLYALILQKQEEYKGVEVLGLLYQHLRITDFKDLNNDPNCEGLFKPIGLIKEDEDAYFYLDPDICNGNDNSSAFYNVKSFKGNIFSTGRGNSRNKGRVLTSDMFSECLETALERKDFFIQQLKDGIFKIHPVENSTFPNQGCSYCIYKDICFECNEADRNKLDKVDNNGEE